MSHKYGFTQHSFVHSDTGLISVKHIKLGDRVLQHDGSYSQVSYVSKQKTTHTIKIQHEDGFIWCHQNQYIAVLTGIDQISWKKVRHLIDGDIILSTCIPIPGLTTLLPNHHFTKSTTGRGSQSIDLVVPPAFTVDHAWLIGVIHGDGYIAKRSNSSNGELSIAFHTSEHARAEKARSVLLQFGEFHITITKRKNADCLIVRCASRQLYTYFKRYIKGSHGRMKIPKCILQGTINHRKAYLAGLFDTDGSCVGSSIELLSSTYPIFLRKVQDIAYSCIGETRYHGPYKNDYKTSHAPLTQAERFYREKSGEGKYNCSLHIITTWTMWHFDNPRYFHREYNIRKSKKANGFPKEFTTSIQQSIRVKRGLNGSRSTIRYNKDSYTEDNGDLWYCPVRVKNILYDNHHTTVYQIRTVTGVMVVSGFLFNDGFDVQDIDLTTTDQNTGIYEKIMDSMDLGLSD